MTAYATQADFLATFEAGAPSSAARLARIDSALAEASSQLTGIIGWDFYQHPSGGGTEVHVFDGSGIGRLCIHRGIVSLSLVEVAYGADLSYAALGSNAWYLEPLWAEDEEPYDHVRLAEGALVTSVWPAGQRRVRLTGTFGYAAVPTRVKRATVALARQIYRGDATTPGGQAGPEEFAGAGSAIPAGWPDDAYRAIAFYRGKFWCHIGHRAAS